MPEDRLERTRRAYIAGPEQWNVIEGEPHDAADLLPSAPGLSALTVPVTGPGADIEGVPV